MCFLFDSAFESYSLTALVMQIFVEQDIFIKKSIIRTFYIKIVITDNLKIVITDNL